MLNNREEIVFRVTAEESDVLGSALQVVKDSIIAEAKENPEILDDGFPKEFASLWGNLCDQLRPQMRKIKEDLGIFNEDRS